jgi:hypothetical protein
MPACSVTPFPAPYSWGDCCRCQVAGSYFGINSDSPTNLDETSVFDLFEQAGVSYKAYQESYPGATDGVFADAYMCVRAHVCVHVCAHV